MHGAVVNPFGNHLDHWQGLRPEFRGDTGTEARDAGQWLAAQLLDRAEAGFDRIFIHQLFGGLRNRAVPMLAPWHTSPDKWRAIQQAIRVACNRHKGLVLDFYCAVRSDTSQSVTTIHPGFNDGQDAWLSNDAMLTRREAWEPIIRAVETSGGRCAFTLDDARKMPDVAMRIASEFPGIEVNSEPPLAQNDAQNRPSWTEYAMKMGGFAEQSWTRHLLRNGMYPEPGQPTVRLWWSRAVHAEFGIEGLRSAIKRGYGIYDDTRDADVVALLREYR